MPEPRVVFDSKRLTYRDVFPVLQDWKSRHRPLQIEKHPHVYDGMIKDVSEDTGKFEFSTVSTGEGTKTLVFDFAGSDFQQYSEIGKDWDDIFMVFLRTGDWLILRKWKT